MKKNGKVWVELDHPSGVAIRIFASRKRAFEPLEGRPVDCEFVPGELSVQMDYVKANTQIRDFVFERANGKCELCHTRTPSEMHEKHPRGKYINGRKGEVSRANSVAACWQCHQGPGGAHWDRRVRLNEHILRS